MPKLKTYPNFEVILKLYNKGISPRKIAKQFSVSDTLIRNQLKNKNVPMRNASQAQRKYQYNKTAFDQNSNQAYYWFGFFFADGYICERPGSSVVGMALKQSDVQHLKAFRKFLGSNHPITKNTKTRSCRLEIRSNELTKSLGNKNILPRKSSSPLLPPTDCLSNRHFWRGVVDGDGCISLGKRKTLHLCGTRETCDAFRDFVKQEFPDLTTKTYKTKSTNNHFQIKINGNNALQICSLLYEEAEISLKRKYRKFLDLKNLIASTKQRKLYDILLVDPPWYYHSDNTGTNIASRHYSLMADDDLKKLPVKSILNKNAFVFVWATCPKLNTAIDLIKAWGLHYRGVGHIWVKTRQDGKIIYGQGVPPTYSKPTTELLLVATTKKTGRPVKLLSAAVPQVVLAPREGHSTKPEQFRKEIEKAFGPGLNMLEMFARTTVPGWDAIGDGITPGEDIGTTLGKMVLK